MKKLLLGLLFLLSLSVPIHATTYYISAIGSDSNNGTTKITSWLHAPGMTSCTGVCNSTTPTGGDNFIFRGGDTWHFGNTGASPYVGAKEGWTWNWTGTSGNVIYIGVDKTWFSGGSWVKPIMSGDNALSTSFASSCTYDYNTTPQLINIPGGNAYVTLDNLEISGVCWSGQLGGDDLGMINVDGGTTNHITISNIYCHGWTMTSSAADNFICVLTLGGAGIDDENVFAFNTFDGFDSPHFAAGSANCQWPGGDTLTGCASGQGIYGNAWDVHGNTFRYLSNFMVTENTHTVHDNLFEYLYQTFASGTVQQHPNVMNNLGGVTGDSLFWYNNIMRHTFVTENVYMAVRTNAYIFNNVNYDNMNSGVFGSGGMIGVGADACIRMNKVSNSATLVTAYIYNNTSDDSCIYKFEVANTPLTRWSGTGNFANNHSIGTPTVYTDLSTCATGGTCTRNNTGGNVFQSYATATSQGYTTTNNYAPTVGTNSTVGSGTNFTSSCSTFSPVDNLFCSDILHAARPSSGAWDTGAYQFIPGGGGGGGFVPGMAPFVIF